MSTNARSFFDIYANEYDYLTNAVQREEFHSKEINALIDKYKPNFVLDAGCATGLTASLFARQNIKAVGLDRSRTMLKVAEDKFYNLSELLTFKFGNFESLPQKMHGKFDLVVCLANSITGVGTMSNLIKALRSFHEVLRPGGTLVLQMLNYFSIKDGEFLPIKATRNGDIIYQRFSERRGKRFFIYINRLDISKDQVEYEMFRHEFENFEAKEMTSAMKQSGFVGIKKYADLYLTKPFGASSHDLVITADKE